MIIKELKLTNWGPHPSLTINLDANITGVLGANGSGKSRVLSAIAYALTGVLDRTLEDCIYCYGQPHGAKSARIELTWVKHGKTGRITRSITPKKATRELVWDDNKYTSAADVERLLGEILGADKAAITNAVMISQGTVAGIVREAPAVRNDIMQRLMGLSYVDTRTKEIRSSISKIQASIVDMTPQLEDATAQSELLRVRTENMQRQLDTALKVTEEDMQFLVDLQRLDSDSASYTLELQDRRVKYNNVEHGFNTLLAASNYKTVSEFVDAIKAREESRNTLQKQLMDVSIRISASETFKAALADEEHALVEVKRNTKAVQELPTLQLEQATLATHTQNLNLKQQSLLWQKEQSELLEQQRVLLEGYSRDSQRMPKLQQSYDEAATAAEEIPRLMEESANMKLQLRLVEMVGCNSPLCPLCGSTYTPKSRDDVESLRSEYNTLNAKINNLNANKAATFNELTLCQQTWKPKLDQYIFTTQKLSEVEDSLNTIPDFIKQSSINSLTILVENSKNIVQAIQDATSKESSAWAHYRFCSDRVNNLRSTYDGTLDAEALKDQQNLITSQIAGETSSLEILQKDKSNFERELMNLDFHRKQITEVEVKITNTRQKLQELLDKIQPDHVAYDDLEEALQVGLFGRLPAIINKYRELYFQYTGNLNHYHTALLDYETAMTRVANINKEMERNKDRILLIKDLQHMQHLISKNGIPMSYMMDMFNQVTSHVVTLLPQLGVNFTVQVDPDRPLTYRFMRTDKSDGFWMKQEMLSGGQGIRLAIAMLISFQRVMLPDVGLLVLDEPSTHVDPEGVSAMRELFHNLVTLCNNADMQIIISDHHPDLQTAVEISTVL